MKLEVEDAVHYDIVDCVVVKIDDQIGVNRTFFNIEENTRWKVSNLSDTIGNQVENYLKTNKKN